MATGSLAEVPLGPGCPEVVRELVARQRRERFDEACEEMAHLLAGRTLWVANSTPTGGGVAEMIRTLLRHWRAAGVDVRWVVLKADEEFFELTKRLHNNLHGDVGDGGPLGGREFALLRQTGEGAAGDLAPRVRPGDLVVLEDPQVAGMSAGLAATGAGVIWRSHIGIDHSSEIVARAWHGLLPLVEPCDAFVFTRRGYVPAALAGRRTHIVAPAIDAAGIKNLPMTRVAARRIVSHLGLIRGGGVPTFHDACGGTRLMSRTPVVLDSAGPIDIDREQMVLSLARWDRLKDHAGTLAAFGEVVGRAGSAHLVLAGPDSEGVADDPEGADVLRALRAQREQLPPSIRRRVHLASLPMVPYAENAAMVNALQRLATLVVKNSVAEGFGLGVTEAMWKSTPVIATDVGGHKDQVDDGQQGLLVEPSRPSRLGEAIAALLADPDRRAAMGRRARRRVRARYLNDSHLSSWLALFAEMPDHRGRTG